MAYMQQHHFQQMWRHDDHVTTRKVLLQLFCIWTSYYLHSDCLVVNSEIHCFDVFSRRQKLCKPESIFKQTCVNFFYRQNMTSFLNYITATLRALFGWHGSNIIPNFQFQFIYFSKTMMVQRK